MKVGITRIQLAGAAFARLQAVVLFCFFELMLPLNIWGQATQKIVPIKLVGKLVFVEATVNGVSGYFLFDTGAENLVLNSRYYDDLNAISFKSEIMGFDGQVLASSVGWTESINLGGLDFPNVHAVLFDLSSIEKIKQQPIHGIIGYAILRNTVWQLDFECKQLTIAILEKKEANTWQFASPPTDSIDLQFSAYVPYAFVNLAGKRLRLALDTGSERNLLQTGVIPDHHFTQRGQIKVASLTAEANRLRAGFVPMFSIGKSHEDSLEVVLTDLQDINRELRARLDGILGNAFFMEGKFAIDYRRRKAYFWRKPGNRIQSDIAYEIAP